jgi:hypothetical protein
MDFDFNYWKKLHDGGLLHSFNSDKNGQLWLKTKSIIRKELLNEYTQKFSIKLHSLNLNKQFEELFNLHKSMPEQANSQLDAYIREKNALVFQSLNVEKLESELYKLRIFEWGGDYNNSLDKYLVSHFVKAISSYDELISKFDNEINRAVQGYILSSWYNHWSSILIEHIFKSHQVVLPTVGQIKNVDFFIDDIPFDLKVTYFPSEYLKLKRKEFGFPNELTLLKKKAKELSVNYDKQGNHSTIYHEITEKLKDINNTDSNSVIEQIKLQNLSIIREAQNNPKLLAKWLYENQGEMRFSSENRLFLILIDTNDLSNSWKIKRNIRFLTPIINTYLDSFREKKQADLILEFRYKEKPQIFSSLTDVIFAVR